MHVKSIEMSLFSQVHISGNCISRLPNRWFLMLDYTISYMSVR